MMAAGTMSPPPVVGGYEDEAALYGDVQNHGGNAYGGEMYDGGADYGDGGECTTTNSAATSMASSARSAAGSTAAGGIEFTPAHSQLCRSARTRQSAHRACTRARAAAARLGLRRRRVVAVELRSGPSR